MNAAHLISFQDEFVPSELYSPTTMQCKDRNKNDYGWDYFRDDFTLMIGTVHQNKILLNQPAFYFLVVVDSV